MNYRENKYGIYKYITSDYGFLFYSPASLEHSEATEEWLYFIFFPNAFT